MATKTIENISDTAIWVAHYRAIESKREDALFHDDLAAELAGERGATIARKLRGGSQLKWSLATRTRSIDELIQMTVARGVGTVVNFAAGLDTRPYRLELPSSTRWVEVDLPGILDYKEQKIGARPPRCRLERIRCDLSRTEERAPLIRRLGATPGGVTAVTEGLLYYLQPDQVAAFASELAAAGFRYWIADLFSPFLLEFIRRGFGKALAAGNASMYFASDDFPRFFSDLGWDTRETRSMLLEGRRLGRKPPLDFVWSRLARLAPRERREKFERLSVLVLLENGS